MTPEASTQTGDRQSVGYIRVVYTSDHNSATHRIGKWTLVDDAGDTVGEIYVHVDPRVRPPAIKRLRSRITEIVTSHVMSGGRDADLFVAPRGVVRLAT